MTTHFHIEAYDFYTCVSCMCFKQPYLSRRCRVVRKDFKIKSQSWEWFHPAIIQPSHLQNEAKAPMISSMRHKLGRETLDWWDLFTWFPWFFNLKIRSNQRFLPKSIISNVSFSQDATLRADYRTSACHRFEKRMLAPQRRAHFVKVFSLIFSRKCKRLFCDSVLFCRWKCAYILVLLWRCFAKKTSNKIVAVDMKSKLLRWPTAQGQASRFTRANKMKPMNPSAKHLAEIPCAYYTLFLLPYLPLIITDLL